MKAQLTMLTWRNVHLADALVCEELNARLSAEAGCSLIEHDLMAWLAVSPGQRLRMLDLADRLRVSQGGLTRIVDRLVARGWVERDRPAGNRREVHVILAEAGTTAWTAARATYSRVLQETLASYLGERDLETLGTIAGKLLTRAAAGQALHCLPPTCY